MRARITRIALGYSRNSIQNTLQQQLPKIPLANTSTIRTLHKLHTADQKKSNLGNTILHEAIRADDIRHAKEIILKYGEEAVALMSKTVNDSGDIPLDLIPKTSSKQKEFHSILHPLIKKSNFKKLSEKIQLDEILNKESKENPVLEYNLKIACAIANVTRDTIKKSPSHPECNDNNKVINEKLWKQLIINRFNYDKKEYKSYKELAVEMAFTTISSKVGNCGEFSAVSMLFLAQAPKIIAEPYEFINGDHVFVVIGQDSKSNPFNINTWGKNAVICDSWLGRVFPAADFSQLGTYKHIELAGFPPLNVVTTYNLNYHRMAPSSWLFDFEKKSSKNNITRLFKNTNCQTQHNQVKSETDPKNLFKP